MSKVGPCSLTVHRTAPEPVSAVAWWEAGNRGFAWLCQSCLDFWFDAADDDDALEPLAWGWAR